MAIIEVGSLDRAIVNQAVLDAAAGDDVVMPAGTATWTTALTIGKRINLRGSGATLTKLVNGITTTGYANLFTLGNGASGGSLSDLGIDDGTNTNPSTTHGIIHVNALCVNWRLHHLNLVVRRAAGFFIFGKNGVIDHCDVDIRGWRYGLYAFNGGGDYGDTAWAESADVCRGLYSFVVEDNVFRSTSVPGNGAVAVDGWRGCVLLFRKNRCVNTFIANHGTDSGDRQRAARIIDVVENNFVATDTINAQPHAFRGSTGIIRDNVVTGKWSNGSTTPIMTRVDYYRLWTGFTTFGQADGRNKWDLNEPDIKDTGTITTGQVSTGPANTFVVTDSSKAWGVNQFRGCVVRNPATNRSGLVRSNTANTFTFYTDTTRSWSLITLNAGDQYEFRMVTAPLDIPSRGKGVLLSGVTPLPAGWPQQIIEPIYVWNNKINGVLKGMSNGCAGVLVEGRDFFVNTQEPPAQSGWPVYPHPLTNVTPPPPPEVDTTPPVVRIVSPVADAVISHFTDVIVEVTDNRGVASVRFELDDVSLTGETLPNNGLRFDTKAFINGVHVLECIAKDTSGNESFISVPVNIQNDVTPPVITIISPAVDTVVSNTVTVTIEASDNVAVTSVRFELNDQPLGEVISNAFTFDSRLYTNGLYTIRCIAVDAAGNTTSAVSSIEINNDWTPPTVDIIEPVAGVLFSGVRNIVVTSSDDIGVTRVVVEVDDEVVGDFAAPNVDIPYMWDKPGEHIIRATAYDAIGRSTFKDAVVKVRKVKVAHDVSVAQRD